MGKYDVNAHVLGTCVKYCTNASPLGEDGTYGWRPNIIGGLSNPIMSGSASSGAFYVVNYGSTGTTVGNGFTNNGVGFDAKNSNAIYTDSGHVYPLSLALNFIIKA